MKAQNIDRVFSDEPVDKEGYEEDHKRRTPRNYDKIQYETRIELIKRVVFQKEKLKQASQELGLKLSTAKFIVKCFKKEGRIFKKHGSYLQLTEEEQNMLAGINASQVETPSVPQSELVSPVYVYVPCLPMMFIGQQVPYQSYVGF